MIVHKIHPNDLVQCLQFSEHMLNILQGDLALIITSNEVAFHLDNHVLIIKTADIGQGSPM